MKWPGARETARLALLGCGLLGGSEPSGLRAGPPEFVDVTEDAGIRFRQETGATGALHYPEIMGSGVILFDYDGDGDLDLYFLNGNYLTGRPVDPLVTNVLYRNDSSPGFLRFTDVTEEAAVGDSGYGQGGEAADFDGDGDVDLYVTNVGEDVLFRNEGSGSFTRATLSKRAGWGQSCAAFDSDLDGDLDLYVVHYLTYDARTEAVGTSLVGGRAFPDYKGPQTLPGEPSALLRNEGGLRFTEITRSVGLWRPDGKGMGVACVDLDGDGDIDIYEPNDVMQNFLFVNRGSKFEEDALLAGCAVGLNGAREGSMGVDVGDVDGDGRPDLIVPCVAGEVHTLYRNDWPFFSDESIERGLHLATRYLTGFSPSFLDYDNDGDEDLFISCGEIRLDSSSVADGLTFQERYGRPDVLLENDGSGHFRDVSREAGAHFQRRLVGRGCATGDLDNDGDIDIVVNNAGGEPAVLLNHSSRGNWITLQLVGSAGNRDAIGARVKAHVGKRTLHRWVRGGGGYLSVKDRRVHLGLGDAKVAERIEITWPLGARQILENVRANRLVEVREIGR